ncbi:hypothetical protein AB0D33_25600 [Streptomyces sp. NPDC048404]|uniref:hypothetical protein n=1 Tax=unclassified Streptomyces TaxID=2593676 RepID=UPI003434F1B5
MSDRLILRRRPRRTRGVLALQTRGDAAHPLVELVGHRSSSASSGPFPSAANAVTSATERPSAFATSFGGWSAYRRGPR